MKSVTTMAITGVLAVYAPLGSFREPRLAPPSATDLLHAERRAEEARERLEVPRRRTGSWVQGGGGWGEPSRPERRDDGEHR
jgi:hypothetical protein